MKNILCLRKRANVQQKRHCKERVLKLNDLFEYKANCLKLVDNQVGLKILFLLQEKNRLCVCYLSDILNRSISSVFTTFAQLKNCKLTQTEREVQTFFYSLGKGYENVLNPYFKILKENKILTV